MAEFFLALALFLMAHVLPSRRGLRARMVAAVGERRYLLGYSLLSLALIAWLISAAVRAPVVPLWPTQPWHYHAALTLMLPAAMLFLSGALEPNPLSVAFRKSGYDPQRPGIVGLTRHPILWAFLLWSLAHVLPNGDLVSLILFGGFALFAFGGTRILDRRKRREMGPEWQRLAATGRPDFGSLVVAVVGGAVLWALLLWLHPLVIGPNPAAVLGWTGAS